MSSNEEPELNPELETAELRRQMASTGISAYLEDDLPDIELESSVSLLARLKSIEEPELETAELRRQMRSTGISAYLENDLPDIELESSESLLARLKSIEESDFGTPMPTRRSRRRLAPTLLAGTAAAVVAGVLIAVQPWSTPVAQASTPPLLDYEFAEAARIADAPGVDPADTLEQLALAAERTRSGPVRPPCCTWRSRGGPSTRTSIPTPTRRSPPPERRTGCLPTADSGPAPTSVNPWPPTGVEFRSVVGWTAGRRSSTRRTSRPAVGMLSSSSTCPTRSTACAPPFSTTSSASKRTRSGTVVVPHRSDRNLSQSYVIPPEVMATIWRMLARRRRHSITRNRQGPHRTRRRGAVLHLGRGSRVPLDPPRRPRALANPSDSNASSSSLRLTPRSSRRRSRNSLPSPHPNTSRGDGLNENCLARAVISSAWLRLTHEGRQTGAQVCSGVATRMEGSRCRTSADPFRRVAVPHHFVVVDPGHSRSVSCRQLLPLRPQSRCRRADRMMSAMRRDISTSSSLLGRLRTEVVDAVLEHRGDDPVEPEVEKVLSHLEVQPAERVEMALLSQDGPIDAFSVLVYLEQHSTDQAVRERARRAIELGMDRLATTALGTPETDDKSPDQRLR